MTLNSEQAIPSVADCEKNSRYFHQTAQIYYRKFDRMNIIRHKNDHYSKISRQNIRFKKQNLPVILILFNNRATISHLLFVAKIAKICSTKRYFRGREKCLGWSGVEEEVLFVQFNYSAQSY